MLYSVFIKSGIIEIKFCIGAKPYAFTVMVLVPIMVVLATLHYFFRKEDDPKVTWNTRDGHVNRKSHQGEYEVADKVAR